MINRKKTWKPFGDALNGNEGVTTVGNEIFMKMIDKIEIYKGNLNDSDVSFIFKS